MKYPEILAALNGPLLITPSARESLASLFEDHARLSAEEFKLERTGKGSCGEKIELEQMTVEDGIARIPIGGPLGIRLGEFEKGAGAVDYLDIMADLKSAADDKEVKSVLLYFDSPGGMFSGLPETTAAIAQFEKPIYAYVPEGAMACSAAYWMAAQCEQIFVNKSSRVGSIGVYSSYLDLSEMAAQRGIKVKVFSSGKYKGMGVPGTSLSKDQEKYLQDSILKMAEMFYDHVCALRGNIDEKYMQGQSLLADEALKAGLVDEIVSGEQDVLRFLS